MIVCPACGSPKITSYRSDSYGNFKKRYYKCKNCLVRFKADVFTQIEIDPDSISKPNNS